VHAFMPGCPVCIIELLLLILCFSDKLNNEMALKVKLDLENNVSRSTNASHISKISRLRSRVIYFTRYFPGTHTHKRTSPIVQPGPLNLVGKHLCRTRRQDAYPCFATAPFQSEMDSIYTSIRTD